MVGKNSATMLVAEDDPDEVVLLRPAARKAGITARMIVFEEAQQVMDFLAKLISEGNSRQQVMSFARGSRARGLKPLPRLLLLDLKMPRRNGFDLLEWLQGHPEFGAMPVVVLTNSTFPEDERRARSLGAADFKTKPLGLDLFVSILRELEARYLN